jgi:hypothetical protein
MTAAPRPNPVASGEPGAIRHGRPDATGLEVVRGSPGDEELAALLAVLCSRRPAPRAAATGYEAWRAGRLAALCMRTPRP